jgi:hypothetical protein
MPEMYPNLPCSVLLRVDGVGERGQMAFDFCSMTRLEVDLKLSFADASQQTSGSRFYHRAPDEHVSFGLPTH